MTSQTLLATIHGNPPFWPGRPAAADRARVVQAGWARVLLLLLLLLLFARPVSVRREAPNIVAKSTQFCVSCLHEIVSPTTRAETWPRRLAGLKKCRATFRLPALLSLAVVAGWQALEQARHSACCMAMDLAAVQSLGSDAILVVTCAVAWCACGRQRPLRLLEADGSDEWQKLTVVRVDFDHRLPLRLDPGVGQLPPRQSRSRCVSCQMSMMSMAEKLNNSMAF